MHSSLLSDKRQGEGHAGRDDHPLASSRRRGAIGPVSFGSLAITLFGRGSVREHLASCSSRGEQKNKTKKQNVSEPIGRRQDATAERRDATPNSF